MGTENPPDIVIHITHPNLLVKLNNPQMGTENNIFINF